MERPSSSTCSTSQALKRFLRRAATYSKPQHHDVVAYLWELALSSPPSSQIEGLQIPDSGICILELGPSPPANPPSAPPCRPDTPASRPPKGVCVLLAELVEGSSRWIFLPLPVLPPPIFGLGPSCGIQNVTSPRILVQKERFDLCSTRL